MPQIFVFELLSDAEMDKLSNIELLDYLYKLRGYEEQLKHHCNAGDSCLQKLRERANILQFQIDENSNNMVDGYWNYFKFALTKIH